MNLNSNVIVKCLGKTLKTNVKFLSMVKIKFFDSNDHEITSEIVQETDAYVKGYSEVMICLGEDKVFLVKKDMSKIIEQFFYMSIDNLVMEVNPDIFHLNLASGGTISKNKYVRRITFNTKSRNSLFKSLMCYYTVYNMHYFHTMKIKALIPIWKTKCGAEKKKQVTGKEKDKKANTKYNQRILKNYLFYIMGYIKNFDGNGSFIVAYCKDKMQLDKSQMIQDEKNQQPQYFDCCELTLEISDILPIAKFDKNQNDRDLAYFAYTHTLNYLRLTMKANAFWILKNEIYHKKFNMTDDMTQWEGWQTEVRVVDPLMQNLIFIFLRRKFIPPYYDTYQDLVFLLKENFIMQSVEVNINPQAYQVIHIAANSIYHPDNPTIRDIKIFLEAKIDSLVVDEETLYFYQSVLNIHGSEIIQFGYDLLNNICEYFSSTNVKDQLELIRAVLKKKKNSLLIKTNKWSFEGKTYDFLKNVSQRIMEVTRKKKSKLQLQPSEDISKKEDGVSRGGMIEEILEVNNEVSSLEGTSTTYERKNFKKIWTGKILRFIAYCLDGGLTDDNVKFATFNKLLESCQNTNHDLYDLLYSSINLSDGDPISHREILVQPKSIVSTLTKSSMITYNENAMCSCISSNLFHKYIDLEANKLLAILLGNASSCTNKLLKAVFDNLRKRESSENPEDKRDMIDLIPPLREIFEDDKRNPLTLLLAGKSLCILVKNEKEQQNRIKLVEEGSVIEKITKYLSEYAYDEKFVMCCLDLFYYIMNQLRHRLNDILYINPIGGALMDKFINFFQRPKIPGVYYSQRIMNKVLTIFLPLTSILEAEMKQKFNTDPYKRLYQCLMDLLNPVERAKILDPSEEESSVLEFKIYWLLTVLICKNITAQSYIWDELHLKKLIEINSLKYLTQMKMLREMKDKIPDCDVKCLCKKIYKFSELVYYFLFAQEERLREFIQDGVRFNELRLYAEDRMNDFLSTDDMKTNVFNNISKLYERCQDKVD